MLPQIHLRSILTSVFTAGIPPVLVRPFFWAGFVLSAAITSAFDGYLLGDPDRPTIASKSVGLGVNATTGNLYYSTIDHALPGTELPWVFQRSYNSLAPATDSFGNTLPSPFGNHRWTHNFNIILTFNGAGDEAEVYWGDGHRDGFTKSGGVWQAATPGNFLYLEEVFAGNVTWQIRTRDRTIYQFDNHPAYARLGKIVSRSGHEITLGYDANDNLSSIIDTHGRTITLSYTSNRLTTVALPDTRSFSFTYDGFLELAAFVDLRSNTWSYTHLNGKLIRVYEGGATAGTDAGVIIQNSYQGDGRIEEQKPGFLLSSGKKHEFVWDDSASRLIYTTPELTQYSFLRDTSHRLVEIKQLSISGSPAYTITYPGSGTTPEGVHPGSVSDYANKLTSFTAYDGLIAKNVGFADGRSVVTTLVPPVENRSFYDPVSVTNAAKGVVTYDQYHPLYHKPGRVIIEQPAAVQPYSPTITYNITYFSGGLVQSRANDDSSDGFDQVDYTYKSGTSLPETITYFLNPTNFAQKLVFTYTWDDTGRPVSETDYRGTKTYFYYDNNDNLTDVISGGTWSSPPSIATAATPGIAHTRYVYDAANRRTQTIEHYGSAKERRRKFNFSNIHLQLYQTFDHNDTREVKVDRFTDELRPFRVQHSSRVREDQFHQSLDKTTTVEFLNARHNPAFDGNTDYQYIRRRHTDAQGNLTGLGFATAVADKTDPLADVVSNQVLLNLTYDEIHRIDSITMTLEDDGANPVETRRIEYDYQDDGRKITVDYVDDTLGAKKIFELDAAGRPYRVTEQDNAKSIVASAYRDPAGRVNRVVDPSGFEITYTHNGIGDLLTKTEAHFGQTSWTYDYANGVVTETLPSGYKFRRTYNRLSQLVQVLSTDDNFSTILNTFTFAYDEAGNIAQETWAGTSGSGTRSYTWNVYGELTSVTDPSGLAITYIRDPDNGDIRNILFAGYDLGYAYNVFGQARSLTVKKNGVTLGQYLFDYENVYGALSQCQFPNGFKTDHEYNLQNELTRLYTGLTGQSKILDYTLERNGRGLQSRINVLAHPIAPKLFDLDFTYARSPVTDRLLSVEGHPVNYNGNKNLSRIQGLNIGPFEFDEFNRYLGDGSAALDHEYDAATNRTSTTRGGEVIRYLTDVSGVLPNIIATLDDSNVPTEVFLYGPGGLIGSVKDGEIRGVHSDTNANVVALSDSTTALIRSYMYSPFGDIVGRNGAKDFPFRFAGGVGAFSDPEGVIWMRARCYHPRVREFLSPDPFPGLLARPQSLHRYAYVEGQVLARNDPSGMFFVVTPNASVIEGNTTGNLPSLNEFPDGGEAPCLDGFFVDGAWNTVKGLYNIVRHPIATAQSVGGTVGHPLQTLSNIRSGLVEYGKRIVAGDRRAICQGVFGVIPISKIGYLSKADRFSMGGRSVAVLKSGYYEVNGFKFSEFYYEKLWSTGRGAPSLIANEILASGAKGIPDAVKEGFFRYEAAGWEMIFNPTTREVWHLQPIK